MSQLIPSTAPLRQFKGHENTVMAVAVFPDRRRMVTSSDDKTLRLWDLNTGVMLKKMEEHRSEVWGLAVSRGGEIIASGDRGGEFTSGNLTEKLITWHGETGQPLTQPIEAHTHATYALDFSPDGTVLASGGLDTNNTFKLWSTKTWQLEGNPIHCGMYIELPPQGGTCLFRSKTE